MNVTCPACSSRYAVPDEKIAGRRARMKCKRCGEMITVDGRSLTATAPEAPAPEPVRAPAPAPVPASVPAPPPAAPAHPPSWTLAEPSGTKRQVDTAELVELYRRGEVEPGALLWRPGLSGWLPPYDLPEVSDALQGQGVRVPGSHLDAGFEDDEEATRVAMSPLLPGSAGGGAGAGRTGFSEAAEAFGDEEEVTRAIDSSALASPQPLASPASTPNPTQGSLPAPRLPPLPRPALPRPALREPSLPGPSLPGPSLPGPSLPGPPLPRAPGSAPAPLANRAAPQAPGEASDEAEEATRVFDTSRLASSAGVSAAGFPANGFSAGEFRAEGGSAEQEDEATRVYDSAAHAAPEPVRPPQQEAPRPPSAPPERLDPAFLGSTAPPPEEVPPKFTAQSILSVPPPDEASDVSGVDQPFLAVQRTSVSWRPPEARKRRWGWLLVPSILAAGVAAALWQRPEWVELGRTQVLTWLGRAPAPRDPQAHLPPFDTERVGVVLEEAARTAQRCKLPDGPSGYGRVHVKFVNSGRAQAAQVSEPFAGTEVGECLVALFSATRMPPFSGNAVIVAKNFTIE